jgi:nucleoside-diphosphate-sugar epimerase
MRVLVTGAGGFIGSALVRRLLRDGLAGTAVTRLVAVDLDVSGLGTDPRIVPLAGSIADDGCLERALSEPVDAAFHLASVPGGAAERDPALGRRVNLDATLRLLDLLQRAGMPPRLVFASSVAVYGESLPPVVDEDTPAAPAMSYGAHKLAAEILIADAARRGGVRACSLRVPGVVARPGEGAGLVSAFMSRLFWQLQRGHAVVLPVSASATAWWISVGACVDNLLHAASVDDAALGPRRVVQMPALRLSMDDVVTALAAAWGEDRRTRVTYEPQLAVERLFGAYPPLETPRAHALGFRHDGDAATLVRRATALA